MLAGRMYNPRRPDEVVVTPKFAATFGKGVGTTMTVQLASVQQANNGFDGSSGLPRGPVIRVRVVGVARTPWALSADVPGQGGGVLESPALYARYRANILGTNGSNFINALVRLKGGEAALPAFRADLARVTGRSDIDVWDNLASIGEPAHRVTAYEAACLLAFAVAALVAALFLVGQSVVRLTSDAAPDLQVLQAVGMTRRQAVTAATAGPFLAGVLGATLGVGGAIFASQWMPIGMASIMEPSPGVDADWLVLGAGWVVVPLLVLAGAVAAAAIALSASRRHAPQRRSMVAGAATRAGLRVPVVIGARFALEPGRGRNAVPVRPALVGAVAGVLGVLAAFTFAAGVSDAAANPARFGQTWQLDSYLGYNGQDFGPARQILRAVAADRDVTGVDDLLVGGAQAGQVSVESFTYDGVSGKRLPVVVTGGRMPARPGEIALAPITAQELHAAVGSVIRLSGGVRQRALRVTGIAFVPAGPHNDYYDGAWLTPAGFAGLFRGAHYAFKFDLAAVALRPGAHVAAVEHRLNAKAAAAGGPGIMFSPPAPIQELQQVKDLELLPLALSVFLVLLAVGAVGHALSIAVSHRRHDLAVLRALGMTRRQTRMIIAAQATVLAAIGLGFGVPLGFALGRSVWRAVAGFTPLAYHPPLAVWALLLIAPASLLAANALAAWPQRHAARLRAAQILRAE